MGDIFTLLNGFNLSPVNTLLLGVLIYIFRGFDARLKALEVVNSQHTVSIAVIKARLHIDEDA